MSSPWNNLPKKHFSRFVVHQTVGRLRPRDNMKSKPVESRRQQGIILLVTTMSTPSGKSSTFSKSKNQNPYQVSKSKITTDNIGIRVEPDKRAMLM